MAEPTPPDPPQPQPMDTEPSIEQITAPVPPSQPPAASEPPNELASAPGSPSSMDQEEDSEKDTSDREGWPEDDEAGKDFRRKLKHEAYLTSGLGKNKRKVRVVDTFWKVLWPELEKQGWTKEDGEGRDEGRVIFRPQGESIFYTRIREVIDRVQERHHEKESVLADLYDKEIEIREVNEGASSSTPPRTRKPSAQQMASPVLDLSWKEGGRNFPKRASSIGTRYQVSFIPEAGTYEDETNKTSQDYCDLVFDPQAAKAKGIQLDGEDDILANVPHNIKEQALLLLAEDGYDAEVFKDDLAKLKPTDGSNWSEEKKDRFHREMFLHRRNLVEVRKAMKIPMKTCLAYYLGHYKRSDHYRLVKTVCTEEHNLRIESSDHGYDSCAICGDGGELVICDGCEGEYHIDCLRPPLSNVPDGYWLCDECTDRKFLAAREYLIRKTRLFEEQNNKKRSLDMSGKEISAHAQTVLYRPSSPVLTAVRQFATTMSELLAREKVADESKASKKVKVEREVALEQPEAAAAPVETVTM